MFGLFKKESGPKVVDKVWLSREAKWSACKNMLNLNPQCLFVAWFEETKTELEERVQTKVYLAQQFSSADIPGKMIVFVEHYPSCRKEDQVFGDLRLSEIPVLSALDEPLLMYFGGEKVIELIKKLGMKEDEAIGNSMVVKSIRNAQKKIDEKVEFEKPANSASAWFALNLPGKDL